MDWALSLTHSRNATVVGRGALLVEEREHSRQTWSQAWTWAVPAGGWMGRELLSGSLRPAHKVPAVGTSARISCPGERSDQVHLWLAQRAEILAFYGFRMLSL